jgi:hypothetical protein
MIERGASGQVGSSASVGLVGGAVLPCLPLRSTAPRCFLFPVE